MGQTPSSRSQGKKNNGTHRKVISQGILMWNIKALALTVQKLLHVARVKYQKGGQNDRMTDRRKTICPPILDRGHKKYNSITKTVLLYVYVYAVAWDWIYNHHDPSRMSSRLHSLIKYTTLSKNIKIKIAFKCI